MLKVWTKYGTLLDKNLFILDKICKTYKIIQDPGHQLLRWEWYIWMLYKWYMYVTYKC